MDDISWLDQLSYKLFNKYPYPDTPFVTSNDGSVYWIDFIDKRPSQISIGKNAHHCGLINLIWKKETLEIWDINLFPKYRGRGLGTQLLNWLIAYARQENMMSLWGLVSPEEDHNFDRLLAWYLRNGFTRESPSGKSIRLQF